MSKPTAKAFIPITRQQKKEDPQAADLVFVAFRTSRKAKKQLNVLAAEEGQTLQDICAEAINDLFQKYGKGRVA